MKKIILAGVVAVLSSSAGAMVPNWEQISRMINDLVEQVEDVQHQMEEAHVRELGELREQLETTHRQEVTELQTQLEEARRSPNPVQTLSQEEPRGGSTPLVPELRNFFAENMINTDEVKAKWKSSELPEKYKLLLEYYHGKFEPIFRDTDPENLSALRECLEIISAPVPTRTIIGPFQKRDLAGGKTQYLFGTPEMQKAMDYGAKIKDLSKGRSQVSVDSKDATFIESERNRINEEIQQEKEAYDTLIQTVPEAFKILAERTNDLFRRFL